MVNARGQLDDMIDQAHAALSCPVCHRNFEREELRLRGILERHGVIQASCNDQHNPIIVIFVADQRVANRTLTHKPLTTTDVLKLHQALKTFDGNFRKHLRPNHPQPHL